MGWCCDAYPEHEGFVRGWERVKLGPNALAGSVLREIACPMQLDATVGSREIDVCAVQVCCECGWRSPLLRAPLGTRWAPCIVMFRACDSETDETDRVEASHGAQLGRCFEKECRLAWREHLASMMPGTFFSGKLHPLRDY
jgi:hypothetical protein